MFNCIIPYYMSMSIEKLKIKSSLFKSQTKRIIFQRVEKVFLARCRLLRKFLNFVFLRTCCTSSKHIPYRTKQSFVSILHMFFLFPKNPRIFWKPYICLFAKNEKRQKCRRYQTYGIFKTQPSTLRVATFTA